MAYTMRQAAQIIEFSVLNPLPLGQNRVIYLEGDPGLGKTALARSIYDRHRRYRNDAIKQNVYWETESGQVALDAKPAGKEWKEVDNILVPGGFTHFVAYIAPERDISDWGLPFPAADRKTVDMLPLADFAYGPNDRPFLFLDELDKAVQMMQNVLGRVMHEKKIGNIVFPDLTYVLAAGNKMSSRAGSLVANTHIKNRRTHLPVIVDGAEWIEDIANPWELHSSVVSYIRTDPAMIHKIDTNNPAHPSPRSWTKVALTLTQKADPMVERALIEGDVGEQAANTFHGHLEIYRQLRSVEQFVANPTGIALPKGEHAIAQMWAELTMLARHATPASADAICQYLNRLPPAFCFCGYRDLMQRDSKMVYSSKAGLRYATENAEMLKATAAKR